MKIWYQSLFDVGRIPAYFDGVRKRVGSVARPGTEVHLHAMPEGVYGGRTPAEVVIYPYIASLHAQIILDNALRAQAEGYDVFALSSVQDPAIEEARSLLDIPVVGYGESAIIPGQLYLSEAIVRAGVTRIDEVPIVDGLAAVVKMAEVMADFKKLGITVSRRGYTHARPPQEILEHARNFHKKT